jgi:hypothetical protein
MTMTDTPAALNGAPDQDAGSARPSSPLPRIRVLTTKAGQAIEPAFDGTGDLEDFRTCFLAAFGTSNEAVAEALFGQLLNSLHIEPGKPIDGATANLALALMREIGPKDAVEGMLACQMIVAHTASMDAARRAMHAEQTAVGRAVYLNLARRLMTTFTLQMDGLGRHRGRPSVQKVIVERVYVAPGAQAIMGAVANGRRGDGG